jgi:hypothetical protein
VCGDRSAPQRLVQHHNFGCVWRRVISKRPFPPGSWNALLSDAMFSSSGNVSSQASFRSCSAEGSRGSPMCPRRTVAEDRRLLGKVADPSATDTWASS